jgi:Phage XkdN-like tail assembly chaperone protein, TAC
MQNQSGVNAQVPERIPAETVPSQARAGGRKEAQTTTETGSEAVSKVAAGSKPSAEEASRALSWFLEDDQGQVNTLTFRLNVGISEDRWIRWTVQALDRDVISQIRKRSEKRRGETDEMLASLRLAAAGTVDPPLTDPAVLGQFADPADALRNRFAFKPGLIDQIASQVTKASGYDDDDVEDASGGPAEREVSAAQG